MNPDTIAALQKALQPVAEKIGQTAAYGWDAVLQQQIVYAWIGVFWAVIGILFIIGGAVLGHWLYEEDSYDNFPAFVTAATICFVGGFVFVTGTITAITHFLNPAYYALQFFIDIAKPQ